MYLAQGFLAECFLNLKNIEKAKYTYLQAFKIAIYINITENFIDQVDSMRISLLALGVPKEKLVEECQKIYGTVTNTESVSVTDPQGLFNVIETS